MFFKRNLKFASVRFIRHFTSTYPGKYTHSIVRIIIQMLLLYQSFTLLASKFSQTNAFSRKPIFKWLRSIDFN